MVNGHNVNRDVIVSLTDKHKAAFSNVRKCVKCATHRALACSTSFLWLQSKEWNKNVEIFAYPGNYV